MRRPRGPFNRMALHRRLFGWFGVSILFTGLFVGGAMRLTESSTAHTWAKEVEGGNTFLGEQFAAVWDDVPRRRALEESIGHHFDVDVGLKDATGAPLDATQVSCTRPLLTATVVREGQTRGQVEVCGDRLRGSGWRLLFPLLAGMFALWIASGRISRRLLRPLREVVRVAEEIGQGKLSSRTDLGCYARGEERVLAESINRMAGRIEKQMADQRELLAAVSHELRTPLGHIRILLELGRQNGLDPKTLDEVETEVTEIDSLVGDLLASSRLEFGALALRRLEGTEVARRALERAGARIDLLHADPGGLEFDGDPTLMARALANLLDNAVRHGAGVTSISVKRAGDRIRFAVEDAGPGLAPGEESRAFEAFYHRPTDKEQEAGGLGLGLALVQRIARAHGGETFASNLPRGGAQVGFEVPADNRPEAGRSQASSGGVALSDPSA